MQEITRGPRSPHSSPCRPALTLDWERWLADLGGGATPRPTPFLAHGQLVEACGQPGCPVCRCVRDLAVRALGSLLYEHVTDPETRARLDRSQGFCSWHAWMARDIANAGLSLAIVYEGLLTRIRERLDGTRREIAGSPARSRWQRLWRRRPRVELGRARAERTRCPACTMLGRAEAGYLEVVLQSLGEPEFERAYAGSAGLCLPHLTLAVERFPAHAGLTPLLARTADRLADLARGLRGFIDKHDHRAAVPFSDAEAASWTSALGFVVGQPGLFGNEVPRGAAPTHPAAEPVERRPARAEAETAERERQLHDLHQQLADAAGRASALQYRLRIVEDDRKVLELNVAGERANSRTWEALVGELRAELAELRRRLGLPEPPPPPGA